MNNCYDCQRPEYHAGIRASSEGPAITGWFDCPLHGILSADDVDGEFQCPDCQPASNLLAAAWRLRNGRDVYDNLAAQTSEDHAQRRQPEMVKAGVTSAGVMLAL